MSDIDPAVASMIRNLEEKTGRAFPEWVALARATGLDRHKPLVAELKSSHGLTHGYANLVAITALKPADAPEGDDLVEAQYAGRKAGLKPIYDTLVERIRAFGSDVELAPKKAYVSVRRHRQFALLQPSTATRLDVGINLRDVPASGRLEASGSFNAMCTHRVRVESVDDVDEALLAWLRAAYDAA